METSALQRYFSGETEREPAAVRTLRTLGEAAAVRQGLQPCDVDAVGVDFAAFMLAEAGPRPEHGSAGLLAYVWQAARWFAAKQARSIRCRQLVLVEEIADVAPASPEHGIGADPEQMVLQRQFWNRVRTCLARMPERDREIVRLCLLEGLTSTEAARLLGSTPSAVRKRLIRLRGRLRRVCLAEVDGC